MTDTALFPAVPAAHVSSDADLDLDGAAPADEFVPERLCPWPHPETGELCGLPIPAGAHHSRVYCDLHKEGGPGRKTKRDKAPKSVNLNVKVPTAPGPKAKPTSDEERVTAAMLGYLGLAEGLFRMANDEVCADALKKAAPQLAASVGQLAKYHPGMVKVLAPLKATGEATAWLSLVVAVAPLVIAILAHHELIDKTLATRLGVMSMASEAFAKSATSDDAAD